MVSWYLLQTLQFCLLFMPSTAGQCDEATVSDCVEFMHNLAKVGNVSRHPGPDNCNVLVKKPMTFRQASGVCTEAGGHLVWVNGHTGNHQVEALIEFAQKDGVHTSSSSADAGVWVTACMNMPNLKWVSGFTPPSEEMLYSAELILCSESGDRGVCWKRPDPHRKLPFFCATDATDAYKEEQLERMRNITIVITVTIVLMLVLLVLLAIALGVAIHKDRKEDKNVEETNGAGQGDTPVTSAPPVAPGPQQVSTSLGQSLLEGGQSAPRTDQPTASDDGGGDTEPPSASSTNEQSASSQ